MAALLLLGVKGSSAGILRSQDSVDQVFVSADRPVESELIDERVVKPLPRSQSPERIQQGSSQRIGGDFRRQPGAGLTAQQVHDTLGCRQSNNGQPRCRRLQ